MNCEMTFGCSIMMLFLWGSLGAVHRQRLFSNVGICGNGHKKDLNIVRVTSGTKRHNIRK